MHSDAAETYPLRENRLTDLCQNQCAAILLPPDFFVKRCVVFVKSSNDLSASFTAAESTNASAISGSSITTLAPSDKIRL